jgi:hypothetical protein
MMAIIYMIIATVAVVTMTLPANHPDPHDPIVELDRQLGE